MIKYMGMEFENKQALNMWCKYGNIIFYRKLCRLAAQGLTMEISVKMYELAEILCNQYGMTHEELEQIEIEELKAV